MIPQFVTSRRPQPSSEIQISSVRNPIPSARHHAFAERALVSSLTPGAYIKSKPDNSLLRQLNRTFNMPLIPTVMPEEKGKPASNLGAPGIQLPDNAEQIKEFGEVRNVDAKELNAKLQAQDEKKTQSTPGIHIPDNAKDISAFSEVSKEDAGALNAKLQK